MDDKRLTDEQLTAIAARAEGVIVRTNKLSERTVIVGTSKLAAELSADVPRLLAHIRAQAAANARLRDALAAVVNAEPHKGLPGGYVKVYPDERYRCGYCAEFWEWGKSERHWPGCPIAAARALLEGKSQ